eukprot:TRINITY_DN3433_c0_g1_i1.p1 TRINITY_DN3433_c0_g1~~TRINITY_DN3433_c0_g1_i1.p1  ORF type:complete len:444 (-),score=84.71 TRINITY_DN3433_c0_g1_i1:1068-2399(-)
MLTMCDLEHKQEYITGVLQTLQSAISDFQKLQHKLEVEQNFDKEKKESVAWDFSVQRQNTNQESESFEDVQEYFDDIEDTENVDFTLLTSLISEGKMTVEDAIVLMIRERAMLVDDTNNNASGGSNLFRNKNNLQNNNSFISKISIDLFDQDFEIDENGGNLIETESKMSKRSRSMTPSRVSLAKILNRLHWKILGMKQQQIQQENDNAIEEEENESIESGKKGKQKVKKLREKEEYEQKVAELDEKLLNAYKRKIQQQKNTRERIRKERERIQTIREKQLEKRNEKKEYVIRKMQDAEEKQKEHLRHIQQKARTEAEKLAEISFINMLETQNKRLTLDEKVEFVRERKLQIIKNVQGQQQQKQRDEAAEKKRQEQQKQLEQKFLTQKLKLEEADSRRLKILESKKKNPSDVNQKALMAKKMIMQLKRKKMKVQNLVKRVNKK